jgi:N6-L-threonylcarbamoyladenine synthase
VETAKALALAWGKPLIGVNHLVGHIYASWVSLEKAPKFPLIALVVSGGHTDLVLMRSHGKFKLVGTTQDDSAGEAFDKVARLLGLGYPGGPEIEKLASQWLMVNGKTKIELPRPMINSGDLDFSFSGLKTAVVNLVKSSRLAVQRKAEIAGEFQKAAVDVLVKKTVVAAQKFDCQSIVVGGGVAANNQLLSQLADRSSRVGIRVLFPPKTLAVDNGAMIAAAAFFINKKIDPLKLQANPGLHF